MAMGAAGTHLGTVGGQPAYFKAFAHAHLRQQLAEQEHALATESCNFNVEMLETMMASWSQRFASRCALTFDNFPHRLLRRPSGIRNVYFAIAEDVQREAGNHLLCYPPARFHGILAPDCRARRKNFDEGETRAVALQC